MMYELLVSGAPYIDKWGNTVAVSAGSKGLPGENAIRLYFEIGQEKQIELKKREEGEHG